LLSQCYPYLQQDHVLLLSSLCPAIATKKRATKARRGGRFPSSPQATGEDLSQNAYKRARKGTTSGRAADERGVGKKVVQQTLVQECLNENFKERREEKRREEKRKKVVKNKHKIHVMVMREVIITFNRGITSHPIPTHLLTTYIHTHLPTHLPTIYLPTYLSNYLTN